ncbi:SRPBCC domain-containing protein [Pseudomonas aeruginosa]
MKRPSTFLAGLIAALAVTLMPGCAAPHSTGDAVATGMQNAIVWPEGYLPGTTDNFVSNEVIVAGLGAADVWPLLADATKWPSYYANSADVRFYDGKGPVLADGDRFFFKTFGFPVEAQVTEYVPPANGRPGRVAWHGWAGEEDSAERLDVIHAWLVEDLPGGRVRVLTQESQKGKPAQALAASKPNIMINGHQDWLTGLIEAARKVRTH